MRLKVSVYFISNIKILIMKKRNNKTYEAEEYDASQMSLAYGSPQGHMNGRASKEIVATYEGDELMAHKMYKDQVKNAKKEGLDHLYKQDYQPAKFAKAV